MKDLDVNLIYMPNSRHARAMLIDLRRLLLNARGEVVFTSVRLHKNARDEEVLGRYRIGLDFELLTGLSGFGSASATNATARASCGWIEVEVRGEHGKAMAALVYVCGTTRSLRVALDEYSVLGVEAVYRLRGIDGIAWLVRGAMARQYEVRP